MSGLRLASYLWCPILVVASWLAVPATGLAQSAAPQEQLTHDGRFKQSPAFLDASGESLVYAVLERPVQLRLMKLDLITRQATPLFPEQTKSEFEPGVSRDGRFLAFVQSRGNLSLALVIRDQQTGAQSEVPPEGGFAGFRAPCIAPDNARVLYSFPVDGRQQIFTVSPEAKDKKSLIDSPGINNWPDFAPDGTSIAFSSTRDGDYELYLADADGQNARRLTTSPGQDIRPRFSPDGRQIAFTSNRDGNYEIYLIDVESGEQRRLTSHPERDDFACWHPDGRRLVFVAERDGKQDVWMRQLGP